MSNSILSVPPPPNSQVQTEPAALPPKNQQAAAQTAPPQDKVTISESAKHALGGNAKTAA
jgi:hypothetical protein